MAGGRSSTTTTATPSRVRASALPAASEHHAPAVEQGLVGLLHRPDLRTDPDRPPAPVRLGEPAGAQRSRLGGQREEGLVEQVGEGHRGPARRGRGRAAGRRRRVRGRARGCAPAPGPGPRPRRRRCSRPRAPRVASSHGTVRTCGSSPGPVRRRASAPPAAGRDPTPVLTPTTRRRLAAATSRAASSARSSSARACGSSASPAGVSSTPCGRRRSRTASTCRSSARNCLLSAGCDTCSRAAARVT